ncbi:hypothetical protein KY284_013344 [Solanum tuberosum]|nr:hypothetical protein KY284_013344 [Solanum tuberosum]
MKGRLPNHWQNYDEQSEYPTKTDAHEVFDERLTSCCPTIFVFVETQLDTPIEMASEAGTYIESIAVQLFNEHPQSKLSERYVNAFYPDPDSNEQQIHEIETLEGEISADEVVPNAECGKCFEGEKRDEGVLLVVPSNSEKYPLGGIISAIQNEFHATSELIRLGDADAYYVIIVDRLGHVILCEVINDQKVSKTDEVNSGILQAANQILILFVKRSSMEDQISRTNEDSWSKELTEIRSMLQQLIATNKSSPMEFQRFCGENLELWISQAERYFDCYEIGENHKLSFASSYLEGAAMTWYQWLFQNKQLVDWEHFTAKVLIRFRKRNLKSMKGRLPNHWQNYDEQSEYPTKTDAHEVFDERLTSCCPTIVTPRAYTLGGTGTRRPLLAPSEPLA